jgi:hypothetical protein
MIKNILENTKTKKPVNPLKSTTFSLQKPKCKSKQNPGFRETPSTIPGTKPKFNETFSINQMTKGILLIDGNSITPSNPILEEDGI